MWTYPVLHLLAKTIASPDSFRVCFPDEQIPLNDPLSHLETGRRLHSYYTIAMPLSQVLLPKICNSGIGLTTVEGDVMVVTANIQGWHGIARQLLEDDRKSVKQFATALVTSYPEIFKDLSRKLNSDGTITLRN
jgi:hypothetical protein